MDSMNEPSASIIMPQWGQDMSLVIRNFGAPALAVSSTIEYGEARIGQQGSSQPPVAQPRSSFLSSFFCASVKKRSAPPCGAQSSVPREHVASSSMPSRSSAMISWSAKPTAACSTAARMTSPGGGEPSRDERTSGWAGMPSARGRRSQSHGAASGLILSSIESQRSGGRRRRAIEALPAAAILRHRRSWRVHLLTFCKAALVSTWSTRVTIGGVPAGSGSGLGASVRGASLKIGKARRRSADASAAWWAIGSKEAPCLTVGAFPTLTR